MMGAALAMSICSTCVIPSSRGGTSPGVHVVVGGEGFGILLVAVAAFAPVCLQKGKVQKVKRAPHHVVLAPWRRIMYVRFSLVTL